MAQNKKYKFKRNPLVYRYVRLPWWAHLLSGLAAFLVLKHSFFRVFPGERISAIEFYAAMYIPLLVGVSSLIPAIISGFLQWRRRAWVRAQSSLNSLRNLSWQKFEVLVGAAFERLGYAVQETGGGGADGGMDLILTKRGRRVLVQCKHWKQTAVGAPVIREMYGLMVAEKMDMVMVVTSGSFTKEARIFAEGKPISLVDGPRLVQLINDVK
jgi:restriction system protein